MAQTPAVQGSRGEQEGCGAAQVGQRKASRGAAAASSPRSIAENSSAAAGPRQRLIYNRADASPPPRLAGREGPGDPHGSAKPKETFPRTCWGSARPRGWGRWKFVEDFEQGLTVNNCAKRGQEHLAGEAKAGTCQGARSRDGRGELPRPSPFPLPDAWGRVAHEARSGPWGLAITSNTTKPRAHCHIPQSLPRAQRAGWQQEEGPWVQ